MFSAVIMLMIVSSSRRVGQIKCSVRHILQEFLRHILNSGGSQFQQIVLVNFLFGGPLFTSDFLIKRVVIRNFRDMRNLMLIVYGWIKMSFCKPKKMSAMIFEKAKDQEGNRAPISRRLELCIP